MNWRKQLLTQAKFSLMSFRRNPAATFFTVVLPLIFLVLFTSIFGNETFSATGARVATFYVPGILALSIISATMINLAITTVTRRENGILKRVRGTPLRPWVYVAGEVFAALAITALMTVLVVGIGWLVFDVALSASGIPNLLISLTLGAAVFCALGLALSGLIPNEKSAPAFTNMIALPLYFVSDIFVITENTPTTIALIGDLFPVKHLAKALTQSFDPFSSGTPMAWSHWAVMAGWGIVGALVAVKKFQWTPKQ
ncbi:MAG: ABC-2 type transport system permease protein [Candidatus Poriferisodalaceae bacterium]|jgi:ABC-2 type transport system permease protein